MEEQGGSTEVPLPSPHATVSLRFVCPVGPFLVSPSNHCPASRQAEGSCVCSRTTARRRVRGSHFSTSRTSLGFRSIRTTSLLLSFGLKWSLNLNA